MKKASAALTALILTVIAVFMVNAEGFEDSIGQNGFPTDAEISYGEALRIAMDFVADYFLDENDGPIEGFTIIGRLADYAPQMDGRVWEFGFCAPGKPAFAAQPDYIAGVSAAHGWVCWVLVKDSEDTGEPAGCAYLCGYLDPSMEDPANDAGLTDLILRLYGAPPIPEE